MGHHQKSNIVAEALERIRNWLSSAIFDITLIQIMPRWGFILLRVIWIFCRQWHLNVAINFECWRNASAPVKVED
jgi:hypothetical protein